MWKGWEEELENPTKKPVGIMAVYWVNKQRHISYACDFHMLILSHENMYVCVTALSGIFHLNPQKFSDFSSIFLFRHFSYFHTHTSKHVLLNAFDMTVISWHEKISYCSSLNKIKEFMDESLFVFVCIEILWIWQTFVCDVLSVSMANDKVCESIFLPFSPQVEA